MNAKHIKRNFPMYDTNKQHYDKDYCAIEIFRFNKKDEKRYYTDVGTKPTDNTKVVNWRAWTGFQSTDELPYEIEVSYTAPCDGEYRIQCLYSATSYGYYSDGAIFVDGERLKPFTSWGSFALSMKRYSVPVQLTEGVHTIKYRIAPNTIWLGGCVKHTEMYRADNKNNFELTMNTANYKKGGMTNVDELTFELMYDHSLSETLLPTDPDANPSGFIFDFRDEVNMYVQTLDGNKKRVFGGYVSTVNVDTDLTKLTVQCASRLTDLDKRYTLFEMALIGGDTDYRGYYDEGTSILNVKSYTRAIETLAKSVESVLYTNIPDNVFELDGSRKISMYVDFGNPSTVDKTDKHNTFQNIEHEWVEQGLYLRNKADVDTWETAVLWDTDFYPDLEAKGVNITDTPIFYIDYYMGECKYDEVVNSDGTVEVENGGVVQVNETSKIALTVQKWADNATTSSNPMQIVIDCAIYVYQHCSWSNYPNFIHDGDYVIAHRQANCCDGSRLLAEMCYYKGVVIEYVHVDGHVFNRFNGKWIDWLKMKDASHVGEHVKPNASILKISTYPTRPF